MLNGLPRSADTEINDTKSQRMQVNGMSSRIPMAAPFLKNRPFAGLARAQK
jgi:hypothetical protein